MGSGGPLPAEWGEKSGRGHFRMISSAVFQQGKWEKSLIFKSNFWALLKLVKKVFSNVVVKV